MKKLYFPSRKFFPTSIFFYVYLLILNNLPWNSRFLIYNPKFGEKYLTKKNSVEIDIICSGESFGDIAADISKVADLSVCEREFINKGILEPVSAIQKIKKSAGINHFSSFTHSINLQHARFIIWCFLKGVLYFMRRHFIFKSLK